MATKAMSGDELSEIFRRHDFDNQGSIWRQSADSRQVRMHEDRGKLLAHIAELTRRREGKTI